MLSGAEMSTVVGPFELPPLEWLTLAIADELCSGGIRGSAIAYNL